MACCKCCCGNEDCAEGQEGKCCCGGAEGTCCQEGEYCCSGACQPDPCCEDDEDCQFCLGEQEGLVLVSGIGGGGVTIYKCCPEDKSTGLFPFDDPRGGGCCGDCSAGSAEDGQGGGPATQGVCCDGACAEDCDP